MLSEFDFIQNIKKKFRLDMVGDDCAVLPKDADTELLITADLLIEDIDFRLDWVVPEFLGHKALAVSLSDVAAMGGEARWALISIGVPEKLWQGEFVEKFYEGWHSLARKFGVELAGGDVSRSPDRLVIDSIVGGEVAIGQAVLRSGASVGDLLLVTGRLGGSAGGLKLLSEGIRFNPEENTGWQKKLLLKHLEPWPQLDNALVLQIDNTATAMIDISDGLSSDLAHICEMSGVGARIDADLIPISRQLEKLSLSREEQLDLALNGGEDLELLFSARKEKISNVDKELFTVIGEVTAKTGVIELIVGEESRIITPRGYRHF
jgi:thiamine-monophosphate kinase